MINEKLQEVLETLREIPNLVNCVAPMTYGEIAEAFLNLEKRADSAEAKLAELEKQEPDFHVRPIDTEHGGMWVECGADYHRGKHLFTRPAPAVSLAELVPIEKDRNMIAHVYLDESTSDKSDAYVRGFNECRAAILRNIEGAK